MQSSLGQYQEVQQSGDEPFVLQNPKLLKTTVSGSTVQAKTGSIIAFQGELSFGTHKAFSGEGVDLMDVTGTGEVFLTGNGQEIHLVKLEGDAITCDGDNVLAFEQQMEWDINMVRGFGGRLAGGWVNMTLAGNGWVALLSDASPVLLNTGEAPTFVDPDAAVAWSSGLDTELQGETVGYTGEGWVLVQPAERALSEPGS